MILDEIDPSLLDLAKQADAVASGDKKQTDLNKYEKRSSLQYLDVKTLLFVHRSCQAQTHYI